MKLVTVFAALLLLSAAGCATSNETAMKECGPGECAATKSPYSPDETAVRTHAKFDLRCDDAKLQIVALDPRTFGAEGCGRRATYTNTCHDRDRQDPLDTGRCTWVQTSAPTTDSPAQ